jgi:hypothetical protein
MRMPGYCTRCRKFKQVSVDSHGLVALMFARVVEGTCWECEEEINGLVRGALARRKGGTDGTRHAR